MERKASFSSDSRTEKKVYPLVASDYKLLEEIGKGFSAIVFRAKCIPLGEFVAIKTVDLERCNGNLDDVRREAQTMSLINHPNVVKAYCSFVVEQSLWVVMPFMAGGSCLHIMKAAYPEGFEETIIASFLKETLKALEYLHQQGHIHRDVKAGNILVDGNGAVKLGDFGVSACMFDTGDRQRSRNTFVGTPCWMAPEVMEQVHGYDFKADIWSFGITALELAHGHAPFSKYPPMKVLLMTLQNAPPGLDYERDKKFSKSFKEMVAMCLVKDPSKRPSAEKLLKHSFFKHAKSADYIARTILDPLPPLWERVREVKMRDEARLAEKKMPYGEQEARSQNEYKRGVSSWNFDLEDLKAQAALNEVEPPMKDDIRKEFYAAEIHRASSPPCATSLPTTQDNNSCQQSDVPDHVSRVKSASLPPKPGNDSKFGHPPGKKEPKHFGRFDVFDDDPEQDALDSCNGNGDTKQQRKEEEKDNLTKEDDQGNGKECSFLLTTEKCMESSHAEEKTCEQDHTNQKYNHCSVVESADEGQEDGGIKSSGKQMDENATVSQPSKPPIPSSGPSVSSGAFYEGRCSNGLPTPSRLGDHKAHKESVEDKLKGQAVFQKKGRFSVTSQDDDIQEHGPSSRKNVSIQTSMQPVNKAPNVNDWHLERKNTGPPLSSQNPSLTTASGLNSAMVIPQLQTLFSQTALQQELIVNLMNSINPSEQSLSLKSSSFNAKNVSRSGGLSSVDSTMVEIITERERDLLSQVADLQYRVAALAEELQAVKSRNVQLERQLNAIFNKEEEERIRKEEAARDDG